MISQPRSINKTFLLGMGLFVLMIVLIILEKKFAVSESQFYSINTVLLSVVLTISVIYLLIVKEKNDRINSRFSKVLRFGRFGSAEILFKSEKIKVSRDLANLLEINPVTVKQISFKRFVVKYIPKSDRMKIIKWATNCFSHKIGVECEREFYILADNGLTKLIMVKVLIEDGSALAIVQDVTDQRKLEKAALHHASRVEQILFSITDGFFALDNNWNFTLTNPVFEKMTNFEAGYMIGKNIWELFPYTVKSIVFEKYHLALGTRTAQHFLLSSPNGRILDVHAYPHDDGLFVYFNDVTSRVKMEQALIENESRLRNLSDNLPNGAIVGFKTLDQTGHISFHHFSRGLDHIIDVSADEVIQNATTFLDLVHKEDIDHFLHLILNGQFIDVELRVLAQNTVRWLNLRARQDSKDSSVKSFSGLLLDITERKNYELKQQRQKELESVMYNFQSEFIGEFKIQESFSKVLGKILKLTDSGFGFIGKVLHDEEHKPYLKMFALSDISWDQTSREIFHKYSQEGFEFKNLDTLFGAVLLQHEPVISNSPATDKRSGGTPSGHPPLTSFLGYPLMIGEDLVGVIGLANRPMGYDNELVDFVKPLCSFLAHFIKIIELDKQKQEAQKEIKKLSLIASNTSNLVIFTDAAGRITWVNHSFEQITGFTSHEVIGRKPGEFLQGNETDPEVVKMISEKLKNGEGFRTEIINYTKEGKKYWIDADVKPIRDDNNNLTGFMAVESDITKLKILAEDAINSRNQLQTIMDHAPMVVFMKDLQGKYLFFNEGYKKQITWMDLEPGMTDYDIFNSEFAKECRERDARLLLDNQVIRFEHRVGDDDFFEMKFPIRNASNQTYALGGISINISELKALRKAFAESEQRLKNLADNLWNGAIYQFQMEPNYHGHFTYFSSSVEKLTGLKVEHLMENANLFDSFIHENDIAEHSEKLKRAYELLHGFDSEFRFNHATEGIKWLHVRSSPIKTEDGVVLWNGIVIDVTESRTLREELEENHRHLEELVTEKDFLLREIHHRVKNNLQVISSVLFLKAQTLKEPSMRQLLLESRQRLRSMAFIHERLMQSGGQISKVDIADYITGLIEEQKQVNGLNPEQTKVIVDVDHAILNLEKAVNCGFIINETFTNAVKYAFPILKKGTIMISFKVFGDVCELKISDDGIGLPDHVTLNNDDLFGVQLIRVFTSHLGGTVKLDGTSGTIWTIQFNL